MPIESSTVTTCSPPAWTSRSVRPRQGRISASLAGDQVRAVELGRDVHGQVEAAQRGLGRASVSGVAATKLPPIAKNTLTWPSRIARIVVDGVEAVLARRLEAELVAEPVEEARRAPSPDAHGAVALHVGVAAHRAQPGAGLADVAAQQQQVDDLLDRRDRVLVLGQAHRPADDDAVGLAVALRQRARSPAAVEPGRGEHVVPVELRRRRGDVLVELRGVLGDELLVDRARPRSVSFAERREERLVAAEPDLEEVVGEGGALDQALGALRVVEPPQPGLGERVDGDDARAVPLGLLQRGEHARVVGAGVLPDDEDQVGGVDVLERAPCPCRCRSSRASAAPRDSWHMLEQSGRLLVPKRRTNSW